MDAAAAPTAVIGIIETFAEDLFLYLHLENL